MLVGAGIRAVTTVDIHSRRALELMAMPVRSLSPAPLFAEVLRGAVSEDTVAVAPDSGALSRTHALASALGVERPVAWTEKERSPGGVTHKRVVGELAPRALIFDDILDTGGTLCSCCRELRARGVETSWWP
jgi:ribose-phosphate pyrophosphokinase